MNDSGINCPESAAAGVIARAGRVLKWEALAHRLALLAALNIFLALPATAFSLAGLLHNWPESRILYILPYVPLLLAAGCVAGAGILRSHVKKAGRSW